MKSLLTRRDAIRTLGIGAAALALPLRTKAAAPSDRRLRLAFIGAGGKGAGTINSLTEHHFVAFADVDDRRAADVFEKFPSVPRFRDYRAMLDQHHAEIDGIVISTPDHLHFPMAIAALDAGKHVYLEKPMCTTIWECRQLAAAAAQSSVRTQLGTQGHSFEGLRVLREWIDAGAAGKIEHVICWSDRLKNEGVWFTTPPPAMPVPETLDWNLWLGPRPFREYNPAYAPTRWRSWWSFGSGPVADVGVHMFDVLTFALDLGTPDLVAAEVAAISPYTCPPWSKLTWNFPARGNFPRLEIRWVGGHRDGALVKPDDVPRLPRDLVEKTDNAIAFIGTEGTLFIPDMRASVRPRIFPVEREREFLASPPPRRLPRPKGGHYQDWIDAVLDNRPAVSPLSYGAALTERVLLGTLAQRTGKPIRWRDDAMRTTDNPEADAMVRPIVRDEWRPVFAKFGLTVS